VSCFEEKPPIDSISEKIHQRLKEMNDNRNVNEGFQ